MTDAQIPADPDDRNKFKIIAARNGKTMKALFHEWLVETERKIKEGE